jgi:uncharacterized integral membrane protein
MSDNKIDRSLKQGANKIDSAVQEVVDSKYAGILFRVLVAGAIAFLSFIFIFLIIDEEVFHMGEFIAGLISFPLAIIIFIIIFKTLKKK